MEHITHIRKIILGLSQQEFALMAGVSQSTVSKWESGTHAPSIPELSKIRSEVISRGLKWSDSWVFELPKDLHDTTNTNEQVVS